MSHSATELTIQRIKNESADKDVSPVIPREGILGIDSSGVYRNIKVNTSGEIVIDNTNLNVIYAVLTDTKANILATTPSTGKLAYATDTNEFYLYDGSNWKVAPLELQTESASPDMGAYNEDGLGTSDKLGYYSDAISDKSLNYITLGSGANSTKGAMRLVSGVFQIYANGVWNDVVINFVLREDDDGNYELEHAPVGFDWYYEIMSGNSDKTGIDGKPIVQQYTSSMGAYQPDLQLDCGSF